MLPVGAEAPEGRSSEDADKAPGRKTGSYRWTAMNKRSRRLYARSLGWGLATGAVAGAGTGAAVGFKAGIGGRVVGMLLGFPLVAGCYGAFFGTIFSIVPSAIGALVVVRVLQRRHAGASSPGTVRRDLGVTLSGVACVLNLAFVVGLYLGGNGASSVVRVLPYIVVANVCVAVMMVRARASIGRMWSEP